MFGLPALTAAWFFVYLHLTEFADFVVSLTGLTRSSHLGEAVHFFFYDTPKVLLLLIAIVFVMGILQTFFSAEKARRLLAERRFGSGNTMAALLGIVTPFCSCSAVPMFIGFLSAGVPLGVTFSFLISAPMVNEIALALLLGLFGWKVAALYLLFGLFVAIASGVLIGRLRMENHLQDWVRDLQSADAESQTDAVLSWPQRFCAAWPHVVSIVSQVWLYIVVGILIGAAIHGYVPEAFMASIMGKEAWWSVPAAVLLGIPMYTSAAGVIPVVEALIAKGAALGTVLAFMMSVIALSLPEILILKKVLKLPLIITFVGVVAGGILLVGFLFNLIL